MENHQLARLVERAIKRDPKAFAEIYAEFAPSIYYIGLRMTKNEHDANDVVQETMLRFYENVSNLRNYSAAKAFANKIAYNYCIDISKARNIERAVEDEVIENISLEEEFIPEQFLEVEEQRQYVIDLVDDLSEAQRATVLMYYFENQSVGDIAKTIDTTEEVVASRLYRARQTMKKKLKSHILKEGIVFVMAAPILTKILTMDAKAAYSATASTTNWQLIAEQMQFTPAIIAETLELATAGVGGVVASRAVVVTTTSGVVATGTTVAGTVKTISAIALASLTVATAGYGVYQYSAKNAPSPIQATETSLIVPNTSQGIAVDVPVVSPPDTAEPDLRANDTSVSTREATTSSVPLVSSERFQIKVETNILRLEKGKSISPQQIIEEAGMTLSSPADVVMQYYDQVDFDAPNEYPIYLQVTDDDGQLQSQIVIIIVIEYKEQ